MRGRNLFESDYERAMSKLRGGSGTKGSKRLRRRREQAA